MLGRLFYFQVSSENTPTDGSVRWRRWPPTLTGWQCAVHPACVCTRTHIHAHANSHMLPLLSNLAPLPGGFPRAAASCASPSRKPVPRLGGQETPVYFRGGGTVNRHRQLPPPPAPSSCLSTSQVQSHFQSPPAGEEVSEASLFPLALRKQEEVFYGALWSPGLLWLG